MPIIIQSALMGNMFTISQGLYEKFRNNVIIQWFGTWEHGRPTGGFIWYITHPDNFTDVFYDKTLWLQVFS